MKRINTIDLYVDGNDPSTGVVGDGEITKAVLINNADADTLQVNMPNGDGEGNFGGSAFVYGLTAPVSPEMWEKARQKWVDTNGAEPTEDELLVELWAILRDFKFGIQPTGVNLSTLEDYTGNISPGNAVMYPISGYAQVYAATFADASGGKSTKAAPGNASRAKATLTIISE